FASTGPAAVRYRIIHASRRKVSREDIPGAGGVSTAYPFFVLAVGLAIVIGGIIVLRLHAFLSLITAAIVVSLLAPGEWAEKVPRVAEAFGDTAGGIGIIIALAAVIGMAMAASGAADRVVQAFLRFFGQERGA